jgi:hypothetical protein
MNRMARLLLTLVVAVVLLFVMMSVFQTQNLAQPATWRSTLDSYVAYKSGLTRSQFSVMATSHAADPISFSRDLTAGVFGKGLYYEPGMKYPPTGVAPSPKSTLLQVTEPDRGPAYGLAYGFPVPYSTTDVWCALLRQGQDANTPRRLAFVAYHEEVYQGRWIVHQGPEEPFDGQVLAGLDRMGCKLP